MIGSDPWVGSRINFLHARIAVPEFVCENDEYIIIPLHVYLLQKWPCNEARYARDEVTRFLQQCASYVLEHIASHT